MNSPTPIPEINEPEFEAEVLKSEQPVLVNFWAPWSQPCRRVGSVLDEFAAECNGRMKIVKVKVDDNPDLGMWTSEILAGIQCLSCHTKGA